MTLLIPIKGGFEKSAGKAQNARKVSRAAGCAALAGDSAARVGYSPAVAAATCLPGP
jgi:hypothetical protein